MNIKYLFVVLAIALLAITGCQVQPKEDNTINVQGSSELQVKPDEAEVWAGISILKPTADEAQSEANKVINAIIDGLRYKGITEDQISTENLNLYEETTWTQDEGQKSVGWRASQTLKIKTKDLTKVGEIVDIAVKNGANQINNINFQLSKEKDKEYRQKAIAEATANAREKAETIANSLDAKIGKVKTVSEANYYFAPYAYAMRDTKGGAAVAEAAQVLPRDVTVTANIQVVYILG